jgi:uncharacterized protein (TIRG00374 family)
MKKTILGVIISLLLVLWLFWGLDWGLVWASFKKVRWPYIFLYLSVLFILQFLRSFRWELLLRPLLGVGQKELFPITSVGFMALLILPARGGEFARPYLLSQKKPIPMSALLATIVVERIFDVLSILVFIITVSLLAELPGWVNSAGYIAMALIAVILFFLFLMIAKERAMVRMTERVLGLFSQRILEMGRNFVQSFSRGARILGHWRVMIKVFISSLVLWTVVALLNYIMFFAFSFSLPLVAAFCLVIIMALGLMIPAAPGFVGSYQFLCVISLAFFGIGREEALSFSILSHILQMLFVVGLGLVFLPMMKISGFSFGKGRSYLGATDCETVNLDPDRRS